MKKFLARVLDKIRREPVAAVATASAVVKVAALALAAVGVIDATQAGAFIAAETAFSAGAAKWVRDNVTPFLGDTAAPEVTPAPEGAAQ